MSQSRLPIAFHTLSIRDLSLPVHLGCLPDERREAQEVRFRVECRFHKAPRGIETDEIDETVCYSQISEILRKHCASGEFKLIERLAVEAFYLLRELVPTETCALALSVHKVKPPVPGLLGGSHYSCGDFQL